MRDMPAVIAWMTTLGLPASKSRYARYDKHIKQFYGVETDLLSEQGQRSWANLTHAYRECVDIYLVFKCFEHLRHPKFVSKLWEVVSGEDLPDPTSGGASRNYLFELLVAARFSLAGYRIDFDDTSDVVAKRDDLVIRAECKRIVSEKQLRKRIKEAAEQLARKMATDIEPTIGVIFIDVSGCVISDINPVVNTRLDARSDMNAAVGRFVHRNAKLIEQLNHRYLRVSHGVCLSGTASIWTRDLVLHTCVSSGVRAAAALSDAKYHQLQRSLGNFDTTFEKLFVADERDN